MNRGINSNDSARRYQPKFLLLTLLAYHTCNTSKRENREFLARVVIVAEQVSRIISPVAQIWPGRYAAPKEGGADRAGSRFPPWSNRSGCARACTPLPPSSLGRQDLRGAARDLSTERTCQQREQRGRSREQREHLARSGRQRVRPRGWMHRGMAQRVRGRLEQGAQAVRVRPLEPGSLGLAEYNLSIDRHQVSRRVNTFPFFLPFPFKFPRI